MARCARRLLSSGRGLGPSPPDIQSCYFHCPFGLTFAWNWFVFTSCRLLAQALGHRPRGQAQSRGVTSTETSAPAAHPAQGSLLQEGLPLGPVSR